MKKTIVLCFIHGFRVRPSPGGNLTFGREGEFAERMRELVSRKLPNVNVKHLVYPKYETRGDLGDCVSRFRSWLEEKVIDMEVDAGTPSPTIDPSVRVVLVGHSMGGIVAVETLLGIASEKPIYSEDGIEKTEMTAFNSLLFPYIQGVLAFDTPYLGVSPGVVAHGAEGHYNAATTTIAQLSGLGTALWGANKAGNTNTKAVAKKDAQPAAGWSNWSKVAMVAGAASAVAAGGAAAWMNRDQISEGWSWMSSHLEFVGSLARAEELKKRVKCMVQVQEQLDVGFVNYYTRLGKAAAPKQVSVVGTVLGKDRTFCNLPNKMDAGDWRAAVNDKAADETTAHTTMFEMDENSGYKELMSGSTDLIAQWFDNDWYKTSSEPQPSEAAQA
ncbi:hypothetical protein Golomagni_06762 [Golovinomyces magnicellulatus]|nr:hypothetical protein Golomagni_06762 [Golovinomyces magnicellulatus]